MKLQTKRAAAAPPTPVATAPYVERRLLRLRDVEAKIGLKRAQISVMMREGRFPKPIRLGRRAVAWDSIEIDQWILDRVNAPR